MNVLIKLLPIILVSIIFYLLIYSLYPKYQELINLTKKINELKNKEKEINALEDLIRSISNNSNIQQLVNNKEVLDLWLPQKPKIEDLLASLNGIYSVNNLIFEGVNFEIENETRIYNQNILPVKIISINLAADLKSDNLMNFISMLEENVRLMIIKKAKISPNMSSYFFVESYYLSEE